MIISSYKRAAIPHYFTISPFPVSSAPSPPHTSERDQKLPYVAHSQPPMMQSILLYHTRLFTWLWPVSVLYHYPSSLPVVVVVLWVFGSTATAAVQPCECIHDRYMEFEQSFGGTFSPIVCDPSRRSSRPASESESIDRHPLLSEGRFDPCRHTRETAPRSGVKCGVLF